MEGEARDASPSLARAHWLRSTVESGGSDTDWPVNMRAGYIMDNLIAQGKATPMIVVMPEYFVRGCSSDLGGPFPQEVLGSVVPYIEQNYRVAPGAKNRALAGLSNGANCTRNALLLDPGAFAYIGYFSGGRLSQSIIDQLTQKGIDLPTLVAAINSGTKLLWISSGGLEGTPSDLPLLDQYGIKYTYELIVYMSI